MIDRPSNAVIQGFALALALALVGGGLLAPDADWDWALFALLLPFSVVSELNVIPVRGNLKLSGSFLAIVTAVVFLGAAPGALIGVATIAAGWLVNRYDRVDLLVNLVTYAWFPLAAGFAFHSVEDAFDLAPPAASFYLLVFGLFVLALIIDFVLIAGYTCYLEASSFRTKVRRALVPLLPSELASAVLAVMVAYAYAEAGLATIALFGLVIGVFQYLLGALLVSQERAEELELRAKQLAGFQIALLGALLRTLDLRDQMTARHSASVARFAREIAREAGLSEHDQELVHTAGLLHDIGKFVLPDGILKSPTPLTEEQWAEVKRHPYEGARIVSEIDGYAPVSEIILAHHERVDGLGYPRGLAGDEIPELARVIAVADSYDVMTARDSYRAPISSYEAIAELRRCAGGQFDPRFVEAMVRVLESKEIAGRTGNNADLEAELALDRRIMEYVGATGAHAKTGREPESATRLSPV